MVASDSHYSAKTLAVYNARLIPSFLFSSILNKSDQQLSKYPQKLCSSPLFCFRHLGLPYDQPLTSTVTKGTSPSCGFEQFLTSVYHSTVFTSFEITRNSPEKRHEKPDHVQRLYNFIKRRKAFDFFDYTLQSALLGEKVLFLADNENSEINQDCVHKGTLFFELDDKSKVIQYRAIETISCSIILFHFVIFDPFPPFSLVQKGVQKGGVHVLSTPSEA